MRWDTVVVGGGYCGVTTAVELGRLLPGARILLLEAADRLGGRARSFPAPTAPGAAPQCLDLGAHYFGAEHRRVRALAERLLAPEQIYSHVANYGDNPAFRNFLDGTWRTTTLRDSVLGIQGLDATAPLHHRVCILKSLAWYLACESLINTRAPGRTPFAARLDRRSVADWVDRQRIPQWVKEMWRLACLDILSIEPERISLLYWLWYHAANGGFLRVANDRAGGPQEFAVDVGLDGLLERYAKEIAGEVRLDTPVTAVDHSHPDHVVLSTAAGERIEASRAVIAVTPYAAGRHLTFFPALPEMRQRWHRQPIGHAAKAVVCYPTPWWRDCHGYHYYGMSGGAFAQGIEWALDTSHPDGRQYSLTVFVGAAATETTIPQQLAETFDDPRALGHTHLELHRWQEIRYVGGGPNTHLSPGVLSRFGANPHGPEGPGGRVYFASSEHSTVFTGYVEGAIAAGQRVAALLAGDAAGRAADGRGPNYLRALAAFAAWALLAPVAELTRWPLRRRT